jgi:hypothetical protein
VKITESRRVKWTALIVSGLLVVSLLLYLDRRRGDTKSAEMPAPATVKAAKVDPWKQAALKVEEDRGEPTGRQAEITIPAQLKHYSDTKRFLGIQVAEWRKHRFETPHDYSDLAELIRAGELVELQPLGESYILYGVGLRADDGPFTHFDEKTRERITLYVDEAELRQEQERIAAALKELKDATTAAREELRETKGAERERRASLQSEIKEKEKEATALNEKKKLLDSYYGDRRRREMLTQEYERVAGLAGDFSGQRYDLSNPASRKELKVRMLSCLRPAALRVLEEVAGSYKRKFGRPLPITSLVRPDEYQFLLSKVNPNATGIDTPPHSTGLAFDVYYRYMTAEEQEFLMEELARLKDEGRIETLRENRDHYHVFAFIEGQRPEESIIREALGKREEAVAERPAEKKQPDKAAAKPKGRETPIKGKRTQAKETTARGRRAPEREKAKRPAAKERKPQRRKGR